MAISNERFTTLFLNWWEITEKDMTLSDMEDVCKDIGMTRDEFIELVSQSNEFISKSGWTPPDSNTVRKSKRQASAKDVNIGDTDQAILETALTQIGIKYEYHKGDDGVNWIEIKDENDWSVEIHFNNDGRFLQIAC